MVEWNGVRLQGLSFEQVYHVISSTRDSRKHEMVIHRYIRDHMSDEPTSFRLGSRNNAMSTRRHSSAYLSTYHSRNNNNTLGPFHPQQQQLSAQFSHPETDLDAGRLQIRFWLDTGRSELNVTVVSARDLFPIGTSSEPPPQAYCVVSLLPNETSSEVTDSPRRGSSFCRRWTNRHSASWEPRWDQKFALWPVTNVASVAVDAAVYDAQPLPELPKQPHSRCIGFVTLILSEVPLNNEAYWYRLARPELGSRSDMEMIPPAMNAAHGEITGMNRQASEPSFLTKTEPPKLKSIKKPDRRSYSELGSLHNQMEPSVSPPTDHVARSYQVATSMAEQSLTQTHPESAPNHSTTEMPPSTFQSAINQLPQVPDQSATVTTANTYQNDTFTNQSFGTATTTTTVVEATTLQHQTNFDVAEPTFELSQGVEPVTSQLPLPVQSVMSPTETVSEQNTVSETIPSIEEQLKTIPEPLPSVEPTIPVIPIQSEMPIISQAPASSDLPPTAIPACAPSSKESVIPLAPSISLKSHENVESEIDDNDHARMYRKHGGQHQTNISSSLSRRVARHRSDASAAAVDDNDSTLPTQPTPITSTSSVSQPEEVETPPPKRHVRLAPEISLVVGNDEKPIQVPLPADDSSASEVVFDDSSKTSLGEVASSNPEKPSRSGALTRKVSFGESGFSDAESGISQPESHSTTGGILKKQPSMVESDGGNASDGGSAGGSSNDPAVLAAKLKKDTLWGKAAKKSLGKLTGKSAFPSVVGKFSRISSPFQAFFKFFKNILLTNFH